MNDKMMTVDEAFVQAKRAKAAFDSGHYVSFSDKAAITLADRLTILDELSQVDELRMKSLRNTILEIRGHVESYALTIGKIVEQIPFTPAEKQQQIEEFLLEVRSKPRCKKET